MNLAEELYAYGITERGNTSLVQFETGACAFYAKIEEGKWLEILNQPQNYPAWSVRIVDKTLSEIRTHIEETFSEYHFQKNNIGANTQGNSPVELEYVMEGVRDHLYDYRDNKDFETKDTVTTIHDYLESNDWTLDITDIETLRQEFDS